MIQIELETKTKRKNRNKIMIENNIYQDFLSSNCREIK